MKVNMRVYNIRMINGAAYVIKLDKNHLPAELKKVVITAKCGTLLIVKHIVSIKENPLQ